MLKREDLKPGDIVVSNLHLKVGMVLGFRDGEFDDLVRMCGVAGNISEVPFRHVRHATAEEVAEYHRRVG